MTGVQTDVFITIVTENKWKATTFYQQQQQQQNSFYAINAIKHLYLRTKAALMNSFLVKPALACVSQNSRNLFCNTQVH